MSEMIMICQWNQNIINFNKIKLKFIHLFKANARAKEMKKVNKVCECKKRKVKGKF